MKEKRVVTVGTFDGVHRGHQEVLAALKGYALEHGLVPLVVTFEPHPLEVIAPDRAPKLLEDISERRSHIAQYGVEVEVVPFTEELRRLTAKEWIGVLRDKYQAAALITGYDNKFGSDGRTMTFEEYVRLGAECGLAVLRAPEVPGICSSAIRKAISEGEMESATEMLGYCYELSGRVVTGRQLGRTIGFPTANVSVDLRRQLPAAGVYAAYVSISGDNQDYRAVVNIGYNPTVTEGNRLSIEAHIMDYAGDLYDCVIEVRFVGRIRKECKFGSLDELKDQIARDIVTAEGFFKRGSSCRPN